MANYTYGENGELVKTSVFDTSLMLTTKKIIPEDPELSKEFFADARKKTTPKGRLRDFYNSRTNAALARQIFASFIKHVLETVVSGKGQFMLPFRNYPSIGVGYMKDSIVKKKRKQGHLDQFDMLTANYKIPYLHYSFSRSSKRQKPLIYLNKRLYQILVDRVNNGEKFSKRPLFIDYFLPEIYKKYSYIKEKNLRKIIRHGLRGLHFYLQRGEEMRFLDKEGEIRFFRPLGSQHDDVMRVVNAQRKTREKNKKIKLLERISNGEENISWCERHFL